MKAVVDNNAVELAGGFVVSVPRFFQQLVFVNTVVELYLSTSLNWCFLNTTIAVDND